MDAREKRELRQWKREIKRRGTHHGRRELKRGLRDHPEDAADDTIQYGRYASRRLNGLDRAGSETLAIDPTHSTPEQDDA